MAGIDLGTINSAIARIAQGQPQVIKPNMIDPLLPSAVFIDKTRAVRVGKEAVEAMLLVEERDGSGHSGWKPRMGQDDRYHFPAARVTKTASELSAIIIGQLLKAFQRETGECLVSCVITVPAKFDQSGYQATGDAARLAGLEHYPLLQEPIAGALAYGFTSDDARANWMVFDLGAGTLDISLMAVREGRLLVLPEGQAGDPNLGGTNFDRELLDFVLGAPASDRAKRDRYARLQPDYHPLRQKYQMDDFAEKTHRVAWNRLRLAVERAKIELSKRTEAVVELDVPLCTDERGRRVEVEVPVTRAAYEKLIAADIERAAHICQTLLARNRMAGKDIDQVILIGGPTKTPLVQQVLAERLKIDLKIRIDPMTAVAQGAALHSETVETPGGRRTRKPVQTSANVEMSLQYQPSSKQPFSTVAGVIQAPAVRPGDISVEIQRDDGLWSSGQLSVDETGFFVTEVKLVEKGRPYQSCFKTTVRGKSGQTLATVEEPQIWFPYPDVKATLANSLSVATITNEAIVLAKQGEPLPARKSNAVKTAKSIRRGSSEDVLRIPVVEAVTNLLGREDTDHVDCSVHVGSLEVFGNDQRMTRDLPKGSEVDITFEIDQSRAIKILAYVPLLDEEFEAQFSGDPYGLTMEKVSDRFSEEKKRLDKIRELQRRRPHAEVAAILQTIDRLRAVDTIEMELARARAGETTAQSRTLKRVFELAGTNNAAWSLQTVARIEEMLARIREGDIRESKNALDGLEQELRSVTPETPSSKLARLEGEVSDLDGEVRLRPYWILQARAAALSGKRARLDQVDAANALISLANRLDGAGAPDSITSSDLREIERMNRRIEEKFADIQQRVQEFLDGLPDGVSPQDAIKSTVTKM